MRRVLTTIIGALALLLLGTMPAAADHAGDWSANADSEIVSETSVLLAGPNTSVETGNLNVNVDAGDVISFDYELHDDAVCGAGAPRVFVAVNGAYTNSFDGNPNQCETDGEQVVTFEVPNSGLITHTGIVFDQSDGYVDGSSVTISNLTVDGEVVHFTNPEPEPEPTDTSEPDPDPTGTPDPTTEPTTEPSSEPTDDETAPATGDDTTPASSQETLPDTGVSLLWLVGGGLALMLGGYALVRRGRTQ